jgi:hypothetical protein
MIKAGVVLPFKKIMFLFSNFFYFSGGLFSSTFLAIRRKNIQQVVSLVVQALYVFCLFTAII